MRKQSVIILLCLIIVSSIITPETTFATRNSKITVNGQYEMDQKNFKVSSSPSEPEQANEFLTIDWLSQSYSIPVIDLLDELNKGYTLTNLHLALELAQTSSLTIDEILDQINPSIIEKLQQIDFSAVRFADKEEPEKAPIGDLSVIQSTYGEYVASGNASTTNESLYNPDISVTSATYANMSITASSTYPTSYDQLAVSRLNINADTAPFSINSGNENVSTINGSLQIQSTDLLLPGRNGLSFALTRKYNSSDALYYDKDIYYGPIYDVRYYPELKARLYYLGTNQTVPYTYGSATDFNMFPIPPNCQGYCSFAYGSFVQYLGQYTYWYFPQYPVSQEFNNEVRNSFEATWKYVDPDNSNSREFFSNVFTLSGQQLLAKAFTTGNVFQDPFVKPEHRGDAYANKTKPIIGENRFPIGKGWSWDVPYIETKDNNKRYIHLFGGSTYELDGNTLKGYPWKDLTLSYDSSITVNNVTSSYVLKSINGQKHFFSSDGRLIQISDAYNNTIQFEYQNVTAYGQVLSKVRDALGNEINISYSATEVILTMGDRTVRYQKIKDPQGNKELLSQVTDAVGRKTQYVYEIASTPFDLVGWGKPTDNYTALLKQVHYPTKSRTEYTYESFNRSLGVSAKETVHRLKSREDIVTLTDGTETKNNRVDYGYNGDGAAVKQSTFSFSTTVNNGRVQTTYSYDKVYIDANSPEVYYNTQIQQVDGTKQAVETMEYNRDKRWPVPIQTTSKVVQGTSQSSPAVISRTYDDYGNLTSEADPFNVVTTYNYDSTTHMLSNVSRPIRNGLTSYTEFVRYANFNSIKEVRVKENNANGALMSSTSFSYDTYGNPAVVTIKDSNRNINVNFEYSGIYGYGFPSKQWIMVTDAAGVASNVTDQFEYNKLTGELIKYIDGKGYITSYQYDKLGRLTKGTYPDGSIQTLTYNDSSNEVDSVDSTGVTTTTKWNPLGWKLSTGINGKGTQQFGYDSYGRMIWNDDGSGNRTSYQYDNWDRMIRMTAPDNAFSTVAYDDINRIVTKKDEEGNITKVASDLLGRMIKQETFNSSVVLASHISNTYDYYGNVLTTTDGKNQTTSYQYDVLGHLLSVTDSELNTTNYTYSMAGEMTQITYPDSNKTLKQYDEMGRLIKETDPAGMAESYFYDANSNLTKFVDRKSQVHAYEYNNRDWLTSSKTVSETIAFGYDTEGRRQWMQDNTGKTQYAYEPASGWLTAVTYPDNRTTQYQYDILGRRTKMTDPFGIVTTYHYNARNLLSAIDAGTSAGEATYQYKKNGQMFTTALKNGINTVYGYDGLNRTSLTQTKAGGSPVNSFNYTYDLTLNQTGKQENGLAYSFTYDPLNRISTSTQFDEQYTYDQRGSRLTLASDKPFTTTNTSYQYDDRDRLTQVTKNGMTVTYRYNGEDLLTERTEDGIITRYYYDGDQIIAEGKVTNGAVAHKASYVRGNGLVSRVDASGSKSYYLQNGHGDIVGLTDANGNTLNTYIYDIWGNPLLESETVPQPFRYSGEFWDSTTGLQYLRARWYDPGVGRFVNEDTYEGQIDNPLSLNLYTYVHNNPLTNVDPTGHWCEATVNGDFYSHPGPCNDGVKGKERYSGPGYSDDSLHSYTYVYNKGVKQYLYVYPSAGSPGIPSASQAQGTTSGPVVAGTTITAPSSGWTSWGATEAGITIGTIIRYSPLGWFLMLSGDSDKNIENQTADDGTPVSDLKPMPKEKIEELGGEDYTAPVKKQTGKSRSDLYWNPRTGRVYSIPKNGGPPQWVDVVTPR